MPHKQPVPSITKNRPRQLPNVEIRRQLGRPTVFVDDTPGFDGLDTPYDYQSRGTGGVAQ
ncbi:MAG: hypothetical protein ACYC7E_17290 [Armatimonadota bacterium]